MMKQNIHGLTNIKTRNTFSMKKLIHLFVLLTAVALISCKSGSELKETKEKYVIIAYVPGFRGALDETQIDATKLTHINYAFVDVKDSVAWLTNIETDSTNFRKLNLLKKTNPDLKIMISLGGWSWSNNFSDAVLTESSRKKFASSCSAMVEQYNLDGVDIDWEYPGFKGEDNVYRAEDRENFTLMFKALRESLDELSKKTDKVYQLTTAVPEFKEFLDKTDMDKASQYLDYVNIMAYDFHVGGSDTVGHHSNLYSTKNSKRSGHQGITDYIAAGVPAEKLVLGVPFYGRSWIMRDSTNRGIEAMADSAVRAGGGYTYIKDSLVGKNGFKRYWDKEAQAPYLFNHSNNQLVVYDDEEAIKIKCEYVKKNKMAGMMFWEYSDDPKLYLLNTMNENL
jgi:chitinase